MNVRTTFLRTDAGSFDVGHDLVDMVAHWRSLTLSGGTTSIPIP